MATCKFTRLKLAPRILRWTTNGLDFYKRVDFNIRTQKHWMEFSLFEWIYTHQQKQQFWYFQGGNFAKKFIPIFIAAKITYWHSIKMTFNNKASFVIMHGRLSSGEMLWTKVHFDRMPQHKANLKCYLGGNEIKYQSQILWFFEPRASVALNWNWYYLSSRYNHTLLTVT